MNTWEDSFSKVRQQAFRAQTIPGSQTSHERWIFQSYKSAHRWITASTSPSGHLQYPKFPKVPAWMAESTTSGGDLKSMSATQRGMTFEPEYLPHFRLFVSLRSGISSKKRPLLLKKGPLSGALLPGIQVLQANETNLLVQSPIVFNGDSMNVVDPIGKPGVQIKVVFSEIRP